MTELNHLPLEGTAEMDTRQINLVRLAREGDRNAFGELVREFEPTVFSIVVRRLRNQAEAAEVTQEVFLRAFRKIGQLQEPERFMGWLKRIAVRLSINRAVRRPRELMQDPGILQGSVQARNETRLGIERDEDASQVREGLSQLRRLDRETLVAFYFEGQSLKQMSDRFESPVGTIKRRLHTARHRLREALADYQPA